MVKRQFPDSVNFSELRRESGMTLAELASASGYSVATINGLELNGEGSNRLRKTLWEILARTSLKNDFDEAGTLADKVSENPAKAGQTVFTLKSTLTSFEKRSKSVANELRAKALELTKLADLLDPPKRAGQTQSQRQT